MSISILVIEDEKILQDAYRLVLSSRGYGVSTGDNGVEGLKQLETVRPDIVLLDLFMPLMDGKEFMRSISTADYPDTTFIVYTNLSDRETEREMLQLGADRFILKSSMGPKDLIELVREITSNQNA